MMERRGRIGLIGWIRVCRGRCPRCGRRLKREIATDQSYTRTVPTRGRPAPPGRLLLNFVRHLTAGTAQDSHLWTVQGVISQQLGYPLALMELPRRNEGYQSLGLQLLQALLSFFNDLRILDLAADC